MTLSVLFTIYVLGPIIDRWIDKRRNRAYRNKQSFKAPVLNKRPAFCFMYICIEFEVLSNGSLQK